MISILQTVTKTLPVKKMEAENFSRRFNCVSQAGSKLPGIVFLTTVKIELPEALLLTGTGKKSRVRSRAATVQQPFDLI